MGYGEYSHAAHVAITRRRSAGGERPFVGSGASPLMSPFQTSRESRDSPDPELHGEFRQQLRCYRPGKRDILVQKGNNSDGQKNGHRIVEPRLDQYGFTYPALEPNTALLQKQKRCRSVG